jgi:hypothetical protein
MRIFRDTDALLRFAYAVAETPICKVSDAQRAMAGASATDKSADGVMTPQDQHAQAAMIRSHVNRLHPLLRAYGWTVYSWSEEKVLGMSFLDGFIAREAKVVNSRLREMLIRRYVEMGRDGRPTHERIATRAGVHKRTVQRYEGIVSEPLEKVRGMFYDELDPHFERAGLIRS